MTKKWTKRDWEFYDTDPKGFDTFITIILTICVGVLAYNILWLAVTILSSIIMLGQIRTDNHIRKVALYLFDRLEKRK